MGVIQTYTSPLRWPHVKLDVLKIFMKHLQKPLWQGIIALRSCGDQAGKIEIFAKTAAGGNFQ